MTNQNIEVPITLIKYWLDILHDEILECRSSGLVNLYESLSGIYNKGVDKK